MIFTDLAILIERINELCAQLHTKPTIACRESGAGKDYIGNIQRGSLPSLEKTTALAEYFDVSVDYLIGRSDIETVSRSEFTRNERYIIDLFRQLTPDEQANITGRLELLVEQHEEAYRKDG